MIDLKDADDKHLVIVAVFLICIVGMFMLADPANTIDNALTGLFGIAVGKSLN